MSDKDKYREDNKEKGPHDIKKQKERCLLVAIDYLRSGMGETEKNLGELARLTETAGGIPVTVITQSMPEPDSISFVHKGKLEEIRLSVEDNKIDTVVFDEELSPIQLKNIERSLNVKVIDRTELILTIFSNNAKSKLSKLQIELAKLEYTLPRLQRMWTHLSRQKGGIGLKGPGERQIELDRRIILRRITKIKRDLAVIKQGIDIRRVKRMDHYRVSLVGYTNSGKSTLLSRLSSSPVYIEDKLFSTLDSLIRKVQLNDKRYVLVSDTVGFIRKLPHQLIESFYATLSEVLSSDLLVIVADISQDDFIKRIEVVMGVLNEINACKIPSMFILNKTDLINEKLLSARIASFAEYDQNPLVISALEDKNIDVLKENILEKLRSYESLKNLRIDRNDRKTLNRVYSLCEVIESVTEDSSILLKCYVRPENIKEFRDYQV